MKITLSAQYVLDTHVDVLSPLVAGHFGYEFWVSANGAERRVVFGTEDDPRNRCVALAKTATEMLYRHGFQGSSSATNINIKLLSSSVEETAEFARLNGTVPSSVGLSMDVSFSVKFYGTPVDYDRVAEKIIKELRLQGIEPIDLTWEASGGSV